MKAYILLENGRVFSGENFGAQGSKTGELVFTTGMGGYIETLTDPSYYGQIVIQTFPQIGNYGMISDDAESSGIYAFGYVVREICEMPSNFRCEKPLEDFLKEKGIIGISGVDTRELTSIIRENGVMNAVITTEEPDLGLLDKIRDFKILNAVENVGSKEEHVLSSKDATKFKIGLWDFGAKANIGRELAKRGAEVMVLPYNTSAKRLMEFDGIMLSNGPGDPAENTEIINTLKEILGKTPIFGICLGHQLLALASGGKTEKLKYGHRGVNQPVKDIETKRTYITSQNHGYAVNADSIKNIGKVRYINANDGTVEGIDYPDKKAFSVQFHPEACSGPKDTEFLFDRFIKMIEDTKK